jgi:2-polyprenyl-3-methyl-5-hydroxy-6-metoxy-1,4-benzoquinol methylase
LAYEELAYEEVIQGNIKLHSQEAPFYDYIHREIWNDHEQKRIWDDLHFIGSKVCGFRALDFGAGTGNITLKLLQLGFHVTAVDISREMFIVLKSKCLGDVEKGKLVIRNVNVDKEGLDGTYDLITIYSTLHHLPDYPKTLAFLLSKLRSKGLIYIGHEKPILRRRKPKLLFPRLIGACHYFSVKIINKITSFQSSFAFDHSMADVADVKYPVVKQVLENNNCKVWRAIFYKSYEDRITTPMTLVYRKVRKPNMFSVIAQKQ